MGGPQTAIQRLDHHFTQLNGGLSAPYFYIGNEPEHGVPWAYNFAAFPAGTVVGGAPGDERVVHHRRRRPARQRRPRRHLGLVRLGRDGHVPADARARTRSPCTARCSRRSSSTGRPATSRSTAPAPARARSTCRASRSTARATQRNWLQLRATSPAGRRWPTRWAAARAAGAPARRTCRRRSTTGSRRRRPAPEPGHQPGPEPAGHRRRRRAPRPKAPAQGVRRQRSASTASGARRPPARSSCRSTSGRARTSSSFVVKHAGLGGENDRLEHRRVHHPDQHRRHAPGPPGRPCRATGPAAPTTRSRAVARALRAARTSPRRPTTATAPPASTSSRCTAAAARADQRGAEQGRPPADSSCNANEGPEKAVNGSVSGGNTDKWCSLGATKFLAGRPRLGVTRSSRSRSATPAPAARRRPGTRVTSRCRCPAERHHLDDGGARSRGNTASVTNHPIADDRRRYVRLNITAPTQTTDNAARIYEVEVYALTDVAHRPARAVGRRPRAGEAHAVRVRLHGRRRFPGGEPASRLPLREAGEAPARSAALQGLDVVAEGPVLRPVPVDRPGHQALEGAVECSTPATPATASCSRRRRRAARAGRGPACRTGPGSWCPG